MKKFLLLGAAVLIATSAMAQMKHVNAVNQKMPAPKMKIVKQDMSKAQTLTVSDFNHKFAAAPYVNSPKKAVSVLDIWYTRPAGAFPSGPVTVDGEHVGEYGFDIFPVKPFKNYTFQGYINGWEPSENLIKAWEYQYDEEYYTVFDVDQLDIAYEIWEQDETPTYYGIIGNDLDDPNADWYYYQSSAYDFDYSKDPPAQTGSEPNLIFAVPALHSFSNMPGYDLFYRQKDFVTGGRFGDNPYTITRVTGLKPFDTNLAEDAGNWLGKNAGTRDGMSRIDGMAQAFEKPTHPYLLQRVGVELYFVDLVAPVEFTCKVYKLDEIPAYNDEGIVRLPAEPGELIATGTFTASPEMVDKASGYNTLFLNFPLMGHDEDAPDLEYEVTPTVDYPILVVLDNYNDEGMEALKSFTTFMSTDWAHDEGFGETAYLKIDDADEDGVFHGDYMWYGLNKMFDFDNIGMCKTGFLFSINIENPFITTYADNDVEYTFPDEGGDMVRQFAFENADGSVEEQTMQGVMFLSSFVTSEGDWFLTCDGEEDLPTWLHIELVDDQVGEVFSFCSAHVSADPLPDGETYREATIRFEIPGDYYDFTFKQGTEPEPQPFSRFDVNRDGEVNIADVNTLIAMILGGDLQAIGDVNEDGEVTLADVNTLIDYILNN